MAAEDQGQVDDAPADQLPPKLREAIAAMFVGTITDATVDLPPKVMNRLREAIAAAFVRTITDATVDLLPPTHDRIRGVITIRWRCEA